LLPAATVEETRLAVEPRSALRAADSHLGFGLATAAIALHVVIASFVAIEPGASRIDHLPGALVPLSVAGAAVWLYPRLRAGLAALTALVFGSLALVSGALVVVEAATSGPDDGTPSGLLLGPAGALLVVLGCRRLWMSRKQHGRRYLRRALIAIAAIAFVYEIAVPVGFALVATQKPRAAVEAADLGRPYEAVTLLTTDGLQLSAWYVPSQNGAAVIAFPGRSGPVPHARMLARHGYGVLMLDMRGQGESDGDANAFGWESYKDLDAAIAWLETRPEIEQGRIGGLGLSVGGELLLEAAARNPALLGVVAEGAGLRSVRESFARQGVSAVELWLQLPFDAVTTAATAVLSGDPPPPSLEELSADIAPRAAFFVYGEEGQGQERALTPAYFEVAGQPKALWSVPGAGHTGALEAQPGEYEQRVIAFFDRALLAAWE
jgi:hypothetical protein